MALPPLGRRRLEDARGRRRVAGGGFAPAPLRRHLAPPDRRRDRGDRGRAGVVAHPERQGTAHRRRRGDHLAGGRRSRDPGRDRGGRGERAGPADAQAPPRRPAALAQHRDAAPPGLRRREADQDPRELTAALVYLVAGASLLLAIVLPDLLSRWAVSAPMVLVGVGML